MECASNVLPFETPSAPQPYHVDSEGLDEEFFYPTNRIYFSYQISQIGGVTFDIIEFSYSGRLNPCLVALSMSYSLGHGT